MAFIGGSNLGGSNLGGSSLSLGGSSGSGRSGDSGGSGSLADGFANPLVASAILMSRDGTMVPNEHGEGPDQPSLDDPGQFMRWDPWVRGTLLQSELNEGLTYEHSPPDAFILKSEGSQLFKLTRPSKKDFEQQLKLVQSWAEMREDRMAEILAQIDNQTAFIAAVTGLNLQRHPRTFEWLSAALSLVIPVEVRFKHALGCHRPVEYSPQVQPIITTPGHGAYPMGHAAQAYMLAYCLIVLLGRDRKELQRQLLRQAARISVNRVVAGVHFPVDAIAGHHLGLTMAEYFLRKCGLSAQPVHCRSWDGQSKGGVDFPDLGHSPAEKTESPLCTKTGPLCQQLFCLTKGEHPQTEPLDELPSLDHN